MGVVQNLVFSGTVTRSRDWLAGKNTIEVADELAKNVLEEAKFTAKTLPELMTDVHRSDANYVIQITVTQEVEYA